MKQILYFSIGAAVGAVSAWFITKQYYKKRLQEDIDAIREDYEDEYTKERVEDKVKELGYISDEDEKEVPINPVNAEDYDENGVKRDDVNPFPYEPSNVPYPINPDQYHDEMVFDKMTLSYYEDTGSLVSDEEEEVNISDFIGRESLDHFGEYESDVLYVRNEKMGTDFEVVLIHGAYEP